MKIENPNWLNEQAKQILREFFDEIARTVAEELRFSSEYAGNIADEIDITKLLIKSINGYYGKVKDELRKKLKEATGLNFDVHGWENKRHKEKKSGVDLGIVLTVKSHNLDLRKTIIVQSKKGFVKRGRIEYRELVKKGLKQAKDMSNITPASFFFLYNSSNVLNLDIYRSLIIDHWFKKKTKLPEKLVEKYERIYGEILNMDDLIQQFYKKHGIMPFPLAPLLQPPTKDDLKSYAGILVVPASWIASHKNQIDGTFEMLLPSSLSFSDFMVDYFIHCIVGDTRAVILEKAGAERKFVEQILTEHTVQFKFSQG